MTDDDLAGELCALARSLFDRGLTPGTSGNVSCRRPGGGFLVTPTNACLGRLEPGTLSRLTADWRPEAGQPPTKEVPLHRAFYGTRGDRAGAVVHLHSPWAVALSCLPPEDPGDVLPAHTPYPVMRLGRVPLLPYRAPGDAGMEGDIAALEGRAKAVLLANHGPVVADATLAAAGAAIEEFEAAARLAIVLRGLPARRLSAEERAALARRFPA